MRLETAAFATLSSGTIGLARCATLFALGRTFSRKAAAVARRARLRRSGDDTFDLHRASLAVGGFVPFDALARTMLVGSFFAQGRDMLARAGCRPAERRLALERIVAATGRTAIAIASTFTEAFTRATFAARLLAARFALTLARRRHHFRATLESGRVEIDTCFIGERFTELVSQDARLDFLDPAFDEFAELERTEGDADEPVDLEAERLEHALHFAVLAFAQAEGEPAVGALRAVERRFDARIVDTLDGDTVAQRIERRLVGGPMHAHAVTPQPAGGWQFEHARKTTVVGQQQQAFGIDIEPPDADDAREVFGKGGEDGGATLGIAVGGHEAARLVEQPQARALSRAERLAVDEDDILRADVEGRAFDDLAVHLHATGCDPLFSVAARAQANARHHLGDALLALGALMGARRGIGGFRIAGAGFATHGTFATASAALVAIGGPFAILALACGLAIPVGPVAGRLAVAEAAFAARLVCELALAIGAHEAATFAVARLAELTLRPGAMLIAACSGGSVTGFAGACSCRTTRGAVLAEAASILAAARFPGTALVVVSFVGHAS